MPQRGHRRVVLNDFKAKKREEGAVDIDLGEGGTVTVDPPAVWPDAVFELLDANDLAAAAAALVGGVEQYQKFTAAGGSASALFAILKDEHGITVGESAASSSS